MKKTIAAALVMASVLVAPYEVDAKSRSLSKSSSSYSKTRTSPTYAKPSTTTTTVRKAAEDTSSPVTPFLVWAAAGYVLSWNGDGGSTASAAQPVRFANATGAAGTGSIMEAEKEQIPDSKIEETSDKAVKWWLVFLFLCGVAWMAIGIMFIPSLRQ